MADENTTVAQPLASQPLYTPGIIGRLRKILSGVMGLATLTGMVEVTSVLQQEGQRKQNDIDKQTLSEISRLGREAGDSHFPPDRDLLKAIIHVGSPAY